MIKFKQYFQEKTVVGLIEPIFINGVGECEAKVDSGNGAYNVLHGEKIEEEDGKITFYTINNKHIEKDIVEMVKINIGAGNYEDRPVVMFDIKIGGKDYNNVKFSIGNRSNNEYPVLIGKDFIRDELDALIDVDGKDMLTKNIEVDY